MQADAEYRLHLFPSVLSNFRSRFEADSEAVWNDIPVVVS